MMYQYLDRYNIYIHIFTSQQHSRGSRNAAYNNMVIITTVIAIYDNMAYAKVTTLFL